MFLGNNGVHDLLPSPRCHRRVAVLQIDLRDLQVHGYMADGFVLGINEALGFARIVDAQALPLFGVGVETVISIADAAID